jgi:hypothetical protein
LEGGEGGVEFVDGCLELGGSFFAEASKGSLREGERVLRGGMDRYPCWERGFSEMGWRTYQYGCVGRPRWVWGKERACGAHGGTSESFGVMGESYGWTSDPCEWMSDSYGWTSDPYEWMSDSYEGMSDGTEGWGTLNVERRTLNFERG